MQNATAVAVGGGNVKKTVADRIWSGWRALVRGRGARGGQSLGPEGRPDIGVGGGTETPGPK